MSAERERAERLKRILEVQARKRRLAEWKLVELKREATALAAASVEIIESLGTQSLLNGLFLDAKASALRRNEARIVTNSGAATEAAAQLADVQGIEKRMERAVAEAEVVAARREERDALAATLDDYLASARTSLE